MTLLSVVRPVLQGQLFQSLPYPPVPLRLFVVRRLRLGVPFVDVNVHNACACLVVSLSAAWVAESSAV